MLEVWKDLDDSRYEVSNTGNIRRKDTGRILKQSPSRQGYARVSLSAGAGKVPKIVFTHREVAKRFVENPDGKPQVNHKDLDKMNCDCRNLEWVTGKENVRHAIENGAYDPVEASRKATAASMPKISKAVVVESESGEEVRYSSRSELARTLKVSQQTISRAVAKGYLPGLGKIRDVSSDG